jgi:hypothetical protein
MKLNEELIRNTFDAIVKYRPAFNKYLIVDEDEDEDDEVDYRILGDLIIKNFPWPIGVELRRLFSGSMRQLDRHRLDQIFKTIERIMQFISFTMLAQVWNDADNKKIEVPKSLINDFEKRFSVLSMGTYSWLIRMLGKAYNDQNQEWFMSEMGDNFDKKFFESLDFWIPERNEIGHYQINLTPEDIERRCVEYEKKLSEILQKMAFVVKYKLISIRDIHVEKDRINKDPKFLHVLNLLNSGDSDFKSKEIKENIYTDSKSVLLLKTYKNIEEYLNLSPLVIDTNTEVLDSTDKFDIKKDIFMYTKYRSGHLMYIGTEVTEKCDLRSLSNYESLVNEYESMVKTIVG